MKWIVASAFIKISIVTTFFLNVGCASFPSASQRPPQIPTDIKIVLTIDPVVKKSDGSDYFAVDESINTYAKEVFASCQANCSREMKIDAYFVATSNSESKYFKVWQWIGVLTLGIVPVYEETKFTLVANIQSTNTSDVRITKNRYLVFSLLLLPVNFFRDWREDLLVPQINLIAQLAQEIVESPKGGKALK